MHAVSLQEIWTGLSAAVREVLHRLWTADLTQVLEGGLAFIGAAFVVFMVWTTAFVRVIDRLETFRTGHPRLVVALGIAYLLAGAVVAVAAGIFAKNVLR
jgi:hypothetical protein